MTGRGVIPNGRKILIAGMLPALLGALYALPALAATCGQVLALSGSAVIATGAQQRPAAVGDSVQTGDTISVPQDSKVRLMMNDGSIVTIAAGTQMTINKYDVNSEGARQDAELTMASGLLRAVVSAGGGTPNFEVKTATGVAAVRGTEYYVDAQRDTTQVYVVSGNVSLTDPAGHSPVVIPPMSASSVAARQAPTPIKPVTPVELSALSERTAFHLGLCQCVDASSDIVARCRPDVAACQAYCGSAHYSFVPIAPASCGSP